MQAPNKNSGWPHKNLFVLSKSIGLLNHIKELCKKHQWRAVDQLDDVKELLKSAEKEPLSAIVVDDTSDHSALENVLALRLEPTTMMKPILMFMSESWKGDMNLVKRTLNVSIMLRPLTIAKFAQTFDEMIRLWETPVFSAIRKVDNIPLPSQTDMAIKILEKLKVVPAAVGICAGIQSRLIEQKGDSKLAEKVLLDGLKISSKDPHLLYGAARFYNRNGLPKIALRLLETLRTSYGDTTLFDLDASFASMQMGKFQKAIDFMSHFRMRGDESQTVNTNLQKLLISEGRVLELENQFSEKKQALHKVISDWDKLEAISA